jgi:hypothetical protein
MKGKWTVKGCGRLRGEPKTWKGRHVISHPVRLKIVKDNSPILYAREVAKFVYNCCGKMNWRKTLVQVCIFIHCREGGEFKILVNLKVRPTYASAR